MTSTGHATYHNIQLIPLQYMKIQTLLVDFVQSGLQKHCLKKYYNTFLELDVITGTYSLVIVVRLQIDTIPSVYALINVIVGACDDVTCICTLLSL